MLAETIIPETILSPIIMKLDCNIAFRFTKSDNRFNVYPSRNRFMQV